VVHRTDIAWRGISADGQAVRRQQRGGIRARRNNGVMALSKKYRNSVAYRQRKSKKLKAASMAHNESHRLSIKRKYQRQELLNSKR